MNEQQIREAILDVIDDGKPLQGGGALPWGLYPSQGDWRETGSRNEAHRLEFCDAVIAKLNTPSISPEDAAKLETVTIGESVRYGHLADVIRAKRQVG